MVNNIINDINTWEEMGYRFSETNNGLVNHVCIAELWYALCKIILHLLHDLIITQRQELVRMILPQIQRHWLQNMQAS